MAKSKWTMREAKGRLSELVRKAHEEGPQTIAVRGASVVVVVAAEQYLKLSKQPQDSLVEFFRKSPLNGVDLNLSRSEGPLTDRSKREPLS